MFNYNITAITGILYEDYDRDLCQYTCKSSWIFNIQPLFIGTQYFESFGRLYFSFPLDRSTKLHATTGYTHL
jgi:hypothetical protein